jgi:hypothetical protein
LPLSDEELKKKEELLGKRDALLKEKEELLAEEKLLKKKQQELEVKLADVLEKTYLWNIFWSDLNPNPKEDIKSAKLFFGLTGAGFALCVIVWTGALE